MKQIRVLKNVLQSTLLVLGFLATFLLLAPIRVGYAANNCPTGQVPTSAGGCCPEGQEQITSTGAVNCPAPAGPNCGASDLSGPNALKCLAQHYINPLIALISSAVGLVVVITIVRGAIEYTSSGGDPAKAAAGKTHIVNALIGLAAYFMVYALLQFIIPGGLFNG